MSSAPRKPARVLLGANLRSGRSRLPRIGLSLRRTPAKRAAVSVMNARAKMPVARRMLRQPRKARAMPPPIISKSMKALKIRARADVWVRASLRQLLQDMISA